MANAGAAPARRSLSDRVVQGLRAEIDTGLRQPGDKLPTEPELVVRFGVSRTVVREAIAALRADGLVESRHGVGVFVTAGRGPARDLGPLARASDSIADIIEELELRAAVEIEAAGLAAERCSPAQEAGIHTALQAFSALVEAGEPTEEADFAFHMAIARATNNGRFEAFLGYLGRRTIPRLKLRNALGGASPLPNRDAELDVEHRAVADAIYAHDKDAACLAMRRHLLGSMERYRALARMTPG